MTNPWLPVSNCGPSCVPREQSAAGFCRRTWRLAAVAALVSTLLPLGVLTLTVPRRFRVGYWRFTARCGLAAVGIRFELVDRRPAHARRVRGALVVANHISLFDILAVAAISPARFVAKADLLADRGVGAVVRCFGILPHQRGRLRVLRSDLDTVGAVLDRGRPVVVFPEGTTWCGIASGRFRPAFFQAAIDTGVPVLPVSLRYHRGGAPVTAPGYVGTDAIGDTLRRVLRARGLVLTAVVHPLQLPAGDRRELAARCEVLIQPAADGVPQTAAGETTVTAVAR